MDVIETLKKHEKEIKDRFGVKKIGLFGSCARGDQDEDSDVDLIVEFDPPAFGKDFEGLYDAFINLSSYLEKLLGRKVDILTPVSIDSIRIKEISEEI
ncbi:MAG: nucleotidyltransferase family protein, partial [Candidatus Thermoplasmatota archaeon]